MPDHDTLTQKAHQLETLVDRWFFETFHGSLVARSTEIWNHVQNAKDDLKRRLATFLIDTAND